MRTTFFPRAVPQHGSMLLHLHHGRARPRTVPGRLAPRRVPQARQRGKPLEEVSIRAVVEAFVVYKLFVVNVFTLSKCSAKIRLKRYVYIHTVRRKIRITGSSRKRAWPDSYPRPNTKGVRDILGSSSGLSFDHGGCVGAAFANAYGKCEATKAYPLYVPTLPM